MVEITQYTTDKFTISFRKPDVLDDYAKIIVSIDQGKIQVEKTEEELEIEDNVITVSLTQEDTGKFAPGKAEVQVNIYYEDTERKATYINQLDILRNNHKKVITNE